VAVSIGTRPATPPTHGDVAGHYTNAVVLL